ncbi:P-loop containing nucleoside triphosphate hydrolase protein [Coprinopsis marcescibilis]|uniref:P-loop containing nucleoside triphosphate hydrolase protein n=1 Tax=Coprinopsis marcescibilis TaxID=230819 RepID=A0A5C3KVJ8_COPMA|nr:P-loop containing nucleoside triphosphate hydrolase protein [Coprinopsis marcescibilis]
MDLDRFEDTATSRTLNDIKKVTLNKPGDVLQLFDSNWYIDRTRAARWMDLLGDYAGNELFVIDGESLFQCVLDDALLALGKSEDDGNFQVLHAYHLLEKMLHEFVSRSANFEIVFFHKYRHLTLCTGDASFRVASRTLARTLLFKHLLKLNLPVHVFDDLQDPQWQKYESINKPMFILMNDGGIFNLSQETGSMRLLCQRKFVFDVLSGHMAMALMKSVTFADSKISTFVYEPKRGQGKGNKDMFFSNLMNRCIQIQIVLDDLLAKQSYSCRHHLADLLPFTSDATSRHDFILALSQKIVNTTDSPITHTLLYLFLIHWFHLPTLSVQDRAQNPRPLVGRNASIFCSSFLVPLFFTSADLLSSFKGVEYDIDGGVFLATVEFLLSQPSENDIQSAIGPDVNANVQRIWSQLKTTLPNVQSLVGKLAFIPQAAVVVSTTPPLKVLPFDNPILSRHLPQLTNVESRAVVTSPTGKRPFLEFGTGMIFSDTRHWHNSKSILPPHLGGAPPKNLDARSRLKALKRNQQFMYHLQLQAATITGAFGNILRQQVIPPVGKSLSMISKLHLKQGSSNQVRSEVVSKGGKKPKNPKLSSKQALLQQIHKEKTEQTTDVSKVWWKEKLGAFSKLSVETKVTEVNALFRNKRTEEEYLGLEIRFYRLHLEIQLWSQEPDPANPSTHDKYSVSILKLVRDICRRGVLTSAWSETLSTLMKVLGLDRYFADMVKGVRVLEDVKPSFKFTKLVSSRSGEAAHDFMPIKENTIEWQLRLFGEYMDRSMDSAPDPRVPFEPDAWQRKVLDCIDDNHSILVVAPTSAGKTFISFYAMEKVLRSSDDGIIVYVAPTKALVTQITAEIYARFSKQMDGNSCWAIHTRDYRINDPQKCQILVTVPEILAIMLLSPTLASVWTPKIQRIILDEIHSIGHQEGGAVWEQILLLAACPIIGLSATIGSPENFNDWLASVQKAHGFQHTFIRHPHRYSHLRKFFYVINDQKQDFVSLEQHSSTSRLKFIHPISTLSLGRNAVPDDLALEARDCLTLFRALVNMKSKLSDPAVLRELEELVPGTFFAAENHLLRQKNVLAYEARLKAVLGGLARDIEYGESNNALLDVVRTLRDPDLERIGPQKLNAHPDRKAFLDNLLPLFADLHAVGNLPAIVFNFARNECELLARHLCQQLFKAEEKWKATSVKWKQKMAQWEAWKAAARDRERAAQKSAGLKQKKKKGRSDEANVEEPAQAPSGSWEESFDPDRPLPQFSFVNLQSSYSVAEVEEDFEKEMRYQRYRKGKSGIARIQWIFDCLRRGIGVHHAGMSKSHRSLVESLFRRGFLQVIIATGTLALGINAPAKTTVFCNDSPFLTALEYRQCSGRAGRRGFDLLGNVVFYGIPMDRVQRLVLSRLPTLGGGFPMTSTLVLRLCNLLEQSNRAPKVVEAIDTLMTLPRVSFASDIGRDYLMHHVRFSIDYLRRSGLLSESGQPMNLFAIAGHLYYTEPSNLALVAIMRAGVLHSICTDTRTDIEGRKRNYILLMCHLFGRKYIRGVELDKAELEARRKKYPSEIVLPPMPSVALESLKLHAGEILQVFLGYARAYIEEHEDELEVGKQQSDVLVLSGIKVEGDQQDRGESRLTSHLREGSIKVTVRSPFVATSGHGDTFDSVQELADTVRNGVHLNAHAIPCIDHIIAQGKLAAANPSASSGSNLKEAQASSKILERAAKQDDLRLNAYLYDYYVHGQVPTLVAANGIRQGDLWYLLEDFRLTLASVRAALQQLLDRVGKEHGQGSLQTLGDSDDEEGGGGEGTDSGYASIPTGDDFYGDGDDQVRMGSGAADENSEEWNVDGDFKRAKGVSDDDWRVYKVVSLAFAEFDIKARAMWA